VSKPARVKPVRRRSKTFPWWPSAIGAAVLLAVAAFLLVTRIGGSAGSGPGAPRERGLPVGAQVPPQKLQSTDGTSVSLDQMRGSKVVVYFYEGGG
jgi:cytochrome oxidase Cu insertion factor (SCO1/SenC/PrrC family)